MRGESLDHGTHGHSNASKHATREGYGHSRGCEVIEMTLRSSIDRDAVRFGAVIRRLREAKGWNLIQFGRKADMNPSYLGCLERGDNTPSLTCVLHLAKVLDVEAWTIVAEVEGVYTSARAPGNTVANTTVKP